MGKDPNHYSVRSGEEYELLFTSKKALMDTEKISISNIPVTAIGEIVNSGFFISGQRISEEEIPGYDHFKDGNE
jgi:thiamine monophosphate kinase